MTATTAFRFVFFGAALALSVSAVSAAEAKQTSLDSQIFQVFERIDGRTNDHEQNVVAARARLDELSGEIETLRAKIANLPAGAVDADSGQPRRVLHGQMISLSAEYLNQSFKLVDSAAAVISANLSDLAKLAEEVRKSSDPTSGALKLQNRIQRNVSAGRSMRGALLQLRNWAQQDNSMANRFHSLRRLTEALDRRISIDKAWLKSRHTDASGAIRNRRLEALDRSVDQLGDMYVEVTSEKDALRDLRDELKTVIQLSRLQLTQDIANRAIPRVDGVKTPATSVKSLKDIAEVIANINNTMIVEASVPNSAAPGSSPVDGSATFKIDGFSNF